MAKKAASAVMVTGRTRMEAALRMASVGREAFVAAQLLSVVGHQHGVSHLDPDDEDHTQQ